MKRSREIAPSRVCLIVDNPLRDLEGMCLLGWYLAKENLEVFLVSTSNLHEVYFIRPDLVLLNYVRKANSEFIKRCEQLGVLIGVIDTEGGMLKDVGFFFKSIFRYVDKVDLYCFWGTRQHNEMQKMHRLPGSTMKITGCQRYDFCVPPWNETLPDVPVSGDKMVLVNTNYPVIQPRFQSATKEAQQLVSDVGFEKEYVDKLLSQSRYARNEMVNAVRFLASSFRDTLFVVRPHPFEGMEYYEKTFSDLRNIEVHQSGSVFPWIKRSILLLHHNCSTAVEAVMMEREPVHLGWIDAPLLEQKASVKVSHCPGSLEELRLILERVLKGQTLYISEEKKVARKEVISDWFYAKDGKNSERIASAIVNTLGNAVRTNISKFDYLKVLILAPLVRKDYRSLVKHALLFLLGGVRYSRLKRLNYISGKEYSVNDVQAIIHRIEKVAPVKRDVTVVPQSGRRYVVNSVRLRKLIKESFLLRESS